MDIERSPFSPRASRGQIVALRMGRLEGRHCCFGACVKYNPKARARSSYAVCPEGRDTCRLSLLLCCESVVKSGSVYY